MTDNAIDEWTLNAIPPGSGRYYAILHADQQSAAHQRTVTTLVSIWSKLCFSNREIEVAQKKAAWWREELNRDLHLHPVMQELQKLADHNPNPGNQPQPIDSGLRANLNEVLSGYESLLLTGSPATEQANQTFHHRTGACACAALCNTTEKPQHEVFIHQAGILLSQLRCLRYLHKHVSNGLLCLPMAELESHGIKPNQFVPGALPDNASHYLDHALKDLQQKIEQCLQGFTPASASPQHIGGVKSIYIYLSLQLQIVIKMQRHIEPLFLPECRSSPLRNYWIAFRAARTFQKIRSRADN